MCIIVTKPSGVGLPNEKYLKHCEERNTDGIGLCWHKVGDSLVHIKKSFKNVKTMINFVNQTITADDSMIIHFRYATHGRVDKGNRHPFPVVKDMTKMRLVDYNTQLAVAHNGVLPHSGSLEFSDSQEFVSDILAQDCIKNNLDNAGIQTLLEDYLSGDRLSFMFKNGEVLLFGEHEEGDDGCFYSNTGYKTALSWWANNRSSNRLADKDVISTTWWDCSDAKVTVYTNKGFKQVCDLCADDCYCRQTEYIPKGKTIHHMWLCYECVAGIRNKDFSIDFEGGYDAQKSTDAGDDETQSVEESTLTDKAISEHNRLLAENIEDDEFDDTRNLNEIIDADIPLDDSDRPRDDEDYDEDADGTWNNGEYMFCETCVAMKHKSHALLDEHTGCLRCNDCDTALIQL